MRLWPDRDARHARWQRLAVVGDREAFRRLFSELHPLVASFVGRRIRQPQDAEDLVSRVFHRLLERLGDFDPSRGSVVTFVLTLARNAVIDHLRTSHPSAPLDGLAGILAADETGALDSLLEREEAERLRELIASLDEKDRDLVVLRYGDGLSYREIAALASIGEDAARQRISRALRELKERARRPRGQRSEEAAKTTPRSASPRPAGSSEPDETSQEKGALSHARIV